MNSSVASQSNSSDSAIALQHVSKQFGATLALRDVTFSLPPSRLYCVLGENGAGKSTMLRIVAGLAAPTRGTVTLFGAAPPQESRHRFGYMPHASLLYDELSGLENLGYYAQLYGISDDAPCRAAMNEVGLDPRLERRVGQYSQGMKQRLSLARALVHSPELLLLDEPFSNVDAASADQMVTRLAAMRNAGKTILVVTHQPQLLERAADEVIRLSAGRVVERRVLRSPQPAVVYSQGGAR